jgi:hypothetical protein
MVSIVLASLRDKVARERLLSHAREIVQPVGYSNAEFDERHAEVAEHLVDIYEREVLAGCQAEDAAAAAIMSFGDRRRLTRQLWRARVWSDLRAAWHLPRALALVILTDVIASTVWMGSDLLTAERSLPWQVSLVVVFGFANTIVYWVASVFARAGAWIVRRVVRGAPRVECGLACGLLGSALAIFLSLRPGAVANLIGMHMEQVAGWRAPVEWAGAVAPLVLCTAVALIVVRSMNLPSSIAGR